MSGRRQSSRLQILSAEGVLRVWRDVTGHRTDRGEYLIVSDQAGIKGERLTVYLASGESAPVPVRVVESQPIICDGAVLHELRLSPLVAETFDPQGTSRDTSLEAE